MRPTSDQEVSDAAAHDFSYQENFPKNSNFYLPISRQFRDDDNIEEVGNIYANIDEDCESLHPTPRATAGDSLAVGLGRRKPQKKESKNAEYYDFYTETTDEREITEPPQREFRMPDFFFAEVRPDPKKVDYKKVLGLTDKQTYKFNRFNNLSVGNREKYLDIIGKKEREFFLDIAEAEEANNIFGDYCIVDFNRYKPISTDLPPAIRAQKVMERRDAKLDAFVHKNFVDRLKRYCKKYQIEYYSLGPLDRYVIEEACDLEDEEKRKLWAKEAKKKVVDSFKPENFFPAHQIQLPYPIIYNYMFPDWNRDYLVDSKNNNEVTMMSVLENKLASGVINQVNFDFLQDKWEEICRKTQEEDNKRRRECEDPEGRPKHDSFILTDIYTRLRRISEMTITSAPRKGDFLKTLQEKIELTGSEKAVKALLVKLGFDCSKIDKYRDGCIPWLEAKITALHYNIQRRERMIEFMTGIKKEFPKLVMTEDINYICDGMNQSGENLLKVLMPLCKHFNIKIDAEEKVVVKDNSLFGFIVDNFSLLEFFPKNRTGHYVEYKVVYDKWCAINTEKMTQKAFTAEMLLYFTNEAKKANIMLPSGKTSKIVFYLPFVPK